MTYDPYFKVTTFFDIEYLRNDTRREVVSALYATAFWLAVSVTAGYCIKMAKPILKPFRPPGSPVILVSSDPCANTQFQGEALQRGLYIHGGGKNWRFSTEIAVYLGNGAVIGSRGCRIESEWYHYDDLEWPLTRVSRLLYTYKSNISKTVHFLAQREA